MKIHPSFFLFSIIALLSCQSIDGIISFPGVVRNPDDCTNDETICTSKGMVCDRETKACFNGACASNINCAQPTATVCSNNTCIPCSEDMDCSAWSTARNKTPRRNFCTSIAQANTCTECRPAMGNADCDPAGMNPTCDAATGSCRPCRADIECPSQICHKQGDYPSVPPDGLMIGQCASESNIAYVDKGNVNCNDNGAGASSVPFCNITPALASRKNYIRVAGNAAIYSAITIGANENVIIIGPGRNANPPATFSQVDANGGTLVLSGAQIITSLAPFSARCRANGKLYLLNSIIQNTAGRGVDAEVDCLSLFVERSRVTATGGYGIVIGGPSSTTPTTSYRIVNTAVVGSGNEPANEYYGVSLGTKSAGYFAFNTIVRNHSGIICSTPKVITDSIVYGNMDTNNNLINVSGCSVNNNRIVTANVDLAGGNEPMLIDTPNNATCCIDKGQPPSNGETVPTDYYGNPRPAPNPSGGGYDIGFHELK